MHFVMILAALVIAASSSPLFAQSKSPSNLAAGVVNGDTIQLQSFAKDVGRLIELNRISGKASEADAIEQAWTLSVRSLVMKHLADSVGIIVRDAQIDSVLYTAPPDYVKNSFVDDKGRYNPALLKAISANADSVVRTKAKGKVSAEAQKREVENLTQSVQVLRSRIRALLAEQMLAAKVSKEFKPNMDSLNTFVEKSSTKYKADVIYMPCGKRAPAPTDQEMQRYYEDNSQDFVQDYPMRKLAVLSWPVVASRNDTTQTLLSVRTFISEMRRLATPKKRDELWDEIVSSGQQSYMHLTADSANLAPLWKAVRGENAGGVVGPIVFKDSLRVLRIDSVDSKHKHVFARMASTTIPASQFTVDSVLADAQQVLRDYDSGMKLGDLAKEHDKKIEFTKYVTESEELFGSYLLVDLAFKMQLGAACAPVNTPRKGIVLAIVVDSTSTGLQPYEAVSDKIRRTMLTRSACMVRQLEARSIVAATTVLPEGIMIAEKPGDATLYRNASIDAAGFIGEDLYDQGATLEIRARKEFGLHGPFLGDNGWYVVNIREIQAATADDIAKQKQQRLPEYISTYQQDEFRKWIEKKVRTASITDNRWMYFAY